MSQAFRLPEILDLARIHGKVTVEGLAAHFDVTVQTIRRDLGDLAEAGKLERVHGGAILPSGVANIGYEERRKLGATQKDAIAQSCARAIPDNASLFLNIGTTTEAVARALLRHKNLLVMTNNLNVANILAANVDCEVIVAGGTLRRADGGLTGSLTTQAVEGFKFDYAVIGCSALDTDGDMLDFDMAEIGVSQTILTHARKRFLVADATKWDRSAPARIGSLEGIDRFFTDRQPPTVAADRLAAWETEIVVAGDRGASAED